MTYNANNISHIFSLPSLICRLVRSRNQLELRDIEDYVSNLYPFLKAEMHLPWVEQDLTTIVKDLTDFLNELGVIEKDILIRAPSPENYAYNSLTRISNITSATIERFYIVIGLLQNQPDISQRELETAAAKTAAQLSAVYGINSPDFFEKSLFSSFVSALKNQEGSMHAAATKLEPVIAIAMNSDIRHNILQAVGHRADR